VGVVVRVSVGVGVTVRVFVAVTVGVGVVNDIVTRTESTDAVLLPVPPLLAEITTPKVVSFAATCATVHVKPHVSAEPPYEANASVVGQKAPADFSVPAILPF